MKNVLWRFSALLALGILWILPQGVSARTVEFQTTKVTAADVALSPDGKTLVFTMLGHLFNLPANGGTAEQLTFGPYYDNDPVFSPDGSQVAFASDRDGSEGNIFVLTLQGRHFVQLTRDERAGRPTWSPDGKSIIYLGYARWTPKGLPAVGVSNFCSWRATRDPKRSSQAHRFNFLSPRRATGLVNYRAGQ
jgi:dipeptidyl aminopeptidase/acylaminoacyl peptidase